MSDPNAGKYHRLFKDEFKQAEEILAGRGGKVEWSTNDYQAFTYREPGVCLVFYPHKTSAGNYHVRVRNQGSKEAPLAKRLMRELYVQSGHSCSFTQNNGGHMQ